MSLSIMTALAVLLVVGVACLYWVANLVNDKFVIPLTLRINALLHRGNAQPNAEEGRIL